MHKCKYYLVGDRDQIWIMAGQIENAEVWSVEPLIQEACCSSLEAARDDHRNISLLRNLRIRYGHVIGLAVEER